MAFMNGSSLVSERVAMHKLDKYSAHSDVFLPAGQTINHKLVCKPKRNLPGYPSFLLSTERPKQTRFAQADR